MRTVAVYPGRFHVFHQGHKAVYDHLAKDPQIDDVFVATSAKQNETDSPFKYDDKITMMTKMGVPAGRIVPVTNPYNIKEIAKSLGLDPEQDRLIYALGAKDAARFEYKPESALQLRSSAKKLQPVGKHAYVEVVPTATFNVLGKPVQSASEIRKMYLAGNDNDRFQIISDLYGSPDPELKDLFDVTLKVNQPQEAVIYGQEKIFAGDNPVNVMRETRLSKLADNIAMLQNRLKIIKESLDYLPEARPRKKRR